MSEGEEWKTGCQCPDCQAKRQMIAANVGTTTDIGGWPSVRKRTPPRPNPHAWEAGIDFVTDANDAPFDINEQEWMKYENAGKNIYAVLTVFVKFYRLGLYPPAWALAHLAQAFEAHLENPHPDLLVNQLRVVGKTSGSQNPYVEYTQIMDRLDVISDIAFLISGFDISFSYAAKSIVEARNLGVSYKTLMNDFRHRVGDPKRFMLKHRKFDPVNDPFGCNDRIRDSFISEFPRRIQLYLRKKMPDIN